MVSELARRLSDEQILPFNCNAYAKQLTIELKTFRDKYQKDLEKLNLDLTPLTRAIDLFDKASRQFHIDLKEIDTKKYILILLDIT